MYKSTNPGCTHYAVLNGPQSVEIQVLEVQKDAVWDQLVAAGFDANRKRMPVLALIEGIRHVRALHGKRRPSDDLFRDSAEDESFIWIGEHLSELLESNYLLVGGRTPAKRARNGEARSSSRAWFDSDDGKEFLKKLVKSQVVLSDAGPLERVQEIFEHAVEVSSGVYPFGDADKLKLLDRKGVKV